MSKLLTFTDGSTLEVCEQSCIHNIIIIFSNPEDMIKAWERFTRDNMSYCTLGREEYYDIVPLDMDVIRDDTGMIIARFESRDKIEMEKIKDEIREVLYL